MLTEKYFCYGFTCCATRFACRFIEKPDKRRAVNHGVIVFPRFPANSFVRLRRHRIIHHHDVVHYNFRGGTFLSAFVGPIA
jgi:hypothetical protein